MGSFLIFEHDLQFYWNGPVYKEFKFGFYN